MKAENDKYDKLIESLRRSAPELDQYDVLEDSVLKKILNKRDNQLTGILDFLFGWIYIRWVRRSLIAVSFALLGFFLWQQNQILNQIDDLRLQVGSNNRFGAYDPTAAIESRQALLRLSDKSKGEIVIPEADLKMLLDSLNNLNIRYKNILELFNDDPEIKKKIEDKLEKELKSRLKL